MLQGDGGDFEIQASYALPLSDPSGLSTGDLDGDGVADLLVEIAGTRGGLVLLRGRGADTPDAPLFFDAPSFFDTPLNSHAVADLDGDGDLDVGYGAASDTSVSVLVNDGAARFGAPKLTMEAVASLVLAGDPNGDGDRDLLVFQDAPAAVAVLWNGDGAIAARGVLAVESFVVPLGRKPHSIAIADLNLDGNLDLATANGGNHTVSILRGRGDGNFMEPTHDSVPADHLLSIALGDLDRDGDLDIVASDPVRGRVHTLFNQGDATLSGETSYPAGAGAIMVATADLDGDGFVDAVSANPGDGSVTLLLNDGSGKFPAPENLRTPGLHGHWAVAPADLDGDGDNDLAVAARNSASVVILRNDGPRGDGPGVGGGVEFTPAGSYPVPGQTLYVVAADFNGDDIPDLATANGIQRGVSIFEGSGDATFQPGPNVPLGRDPYSLTAADVDGDGFTDLVSANEIDGSVSVLLGAGNGEFPPPFHYPVGDGQRFVVTGDLDNDGDVDIVTADRPPATVTVLLNRSEVAVSREDYRESICTGLDFQKMSIPLSGGNVERLMTFVLPAADGLDGLLPPLFSNTRRFSEPREFLRTVFPERFGDLGLAEYSALVEKRASRLYFVGSVSGLRLDADETGGTVAFGFDVETGADAAELLSLEEVRRVRDVLRGAFLLEPLGYAPRSEAAQEVAATWEEPGFPIFPVVAPDPGDDPVGPVATPTFELEVLAETVVCGTFAEAGATRGPAEELEFKSQVRLRAGVLPLPTETETFAAELFDEVRVGPAQELATPLATGTFRFLRVPGAADLTTYRFTYEQEYALADGRALLLALVSPLTFTARDEEIVDGRRVLDGAFFVAEPGTESLQGSIDGVPVLRFGSCGYPTLPLWEVRAELDDGTTLLLRERFEPVESLFRTGPASLVRADVVLAGGARTVSDYWDLVYSAFRHNCSPRYWVLLEPPVAVTGVDGEVFAIELMSPEGPPCLVEPVAAEARYLGAAFEALATRAVVSFDRVSLPDSATRFVRGDANADGAVNLADAIWVLEFLFRRGAAPPCQKAADADDNGRVHLLDVIALVRGVFPETDGAGRAPLPEPSLACGVDPSDDGTSCDSFPTCQ